MSTRIDQEKELESSVKLVNDYSIQVLYNDKRADQEERAKELKAKLEKEGVSTDISISKSPDTASSNQIRYFEENERDVAYALQIVLGKAVPRTNFNLQTVYTETPGSVSIFLKS